MLRFGSASQVRTGGSLARATTRGVAAASAAGAAASVPAGYVGAAASAAARLSAGVTARASGCVVAAAARRCLGDGPDKYHKVSPIVAEKNGKDLLVDPLLNRGTSFTEAERDRLDIRGLVPPAYHDMETQKARIMRGLRDLNTDMERHLALYSLYDRNEHLFHAVLIENISELLKCVYTPVIGQACLEFGVNFRRPRGMFFSSEDRGNFHGMIHNWPSDSVDVVVVTDGGRILGLGDLGCHGAGIPIGKLALYTAAGGIHPANVLPIQLDLGTDNEELLEDPDYLGVRHKRLVGDEYVDAVDELMAALTSRYPNVLIQFEDFASHNALALIDRYRDNYLCFNDDIQGTGCVAAAGVMSAQTVRGGQIEDLTKEVIVCVGAGSAGVGVCNGILTSLKGFGVEETDGQRQFYMVDHEGLLTTARPTLAQGQDDFARPEESMEGMSLLDVVKAVRPTTLLGVSGAGGVFTEEVVREMAAHCDRPIIFPMSNPTSKAECTAEQAFTWTDGRAIVGTGSPFDPVELNGTTYHASQANNVFAFPGLGLGCVIAGAVKIPDSMLHTTSVALVEALQEIDPNDLKQGKIFPDVADIREVSVRVATAVVKHAFEEGLATNRIPPGIKLDEYVKSAMYSPRYQPIVPPHIARHNIEGRTHLRRLQVRSVRQRLSQADH